MVCGGGWAVVCGGGVELFCGGIGLGWYGRSGGGGVVVVLDGGC